MADLFEKVTDSRTGLEKLLKKVPGLGGYMERQDRRNTDKLVRDAAAQRYEEQVKRLSDIQTMLISEGAIDYLDDIERAVTKLRIFIDGVRTASYGHSSLFDKIKVGEDELRMIYEHDLALLNGVDTISEAVDSVDAAIGSDDLGAAIRNLTKASQNAVTAFDRRKDILTGIE